VAPAVNITSIAASIVPHGAAGGALIIIRQTLVPITAVANL
jgi:hypothetical protein